MRSPPPFYDWSHMPYVVPTNVTSINLRKETPASRPDVFEGTDVWVAEVRAGASLSFLRESQNLRSLRIQDAEQLTGLEQLTQIDTLYLQHFPKVASLQSLATLLQLRKLYLSRNPSWDGTRKGLEVESFSPLAGLRELSDLTILGVSPRDRSLTPLYALARLRYVHVAWIDGRRRVQVRSTSNNRLERTAEVAAQAARQTSPQEVSHVRRVVLLRKLSAMDQSIVPNPALLERVAHCLGQPLARWRPVAGGYTVATRWLVTCADGSSAFVKGATDALTATWLRLEYSVYTHIQAPFLPTWRAWDDDGVHPILVLEDLSGAVWQAPWTMARITQVLDTLQQVAATTPPRTLPTLEARRPMLSGWAHVAQHPTAFL